MSRCKNTINAKLKRNLSVKNTILTRPSVDTIKQKVSSKEICYFCFKQFITLASSSSPNSTTFLYKNGYMEFEFCKNCVKKLKCQCCERWIFEIMSSSNYYNVGSCYHTNQDISPFEIIVPNKRNVFIIKTNFEIVCSQCYIVV